jgi:hypothetical protein
MRIQLILLPACREFWITNAEIFISIPATMQQTVFISGSFTFGVPPATFLGEKCSTDKKFGKYPLTLSKERLGTIIWQ